MVSWNIAAPLRGVGVRLGGGHRRGDTAGELLAHLVELDGALGLLRRQPPQELQHGLAVGLALAVLCLLQLDGDERLVIRDALGSELEEELPGVAHAGGRKRHDLGKHRLAAQPEELLDLLAGLRAAAVARAVPPRERALGALAARLAHAGDIVRRRARPRSAAPSPRLQAWGSARAPCRG